MNDPGMTSEQRAAVAVHNATQNRMCLNLSGNGQICVACSEVADQIDAAVLVAEQAAEERGRRSQADLLLECEEALIWCSAADAFKPDGIAALGWQRVVLPVLEHIRIARASLAPRDSGKVP